MTYKQLAVQIGQMTEEQRDCDVAIGLTISDELLPMEALQIVKEDSRFDGILDEGHPVICIEG